MSNSASEKIIQAAAQAKERARAAEAEFDRKFNLIQQKANKPIDLFGGDATTRVVEIRSEVRLASDDLYATLQTLVVMLDNQCRALLEEKPSASAIHTVQKTIVWLNEESQIGNTFTASFNYQNLGDVATAKYIPSMDCKMIQKFWEETFSALPEAKQILADEALEKEKAEQARLAARRNIADLKRQFDNVTALSESSVAAPQNDSAQQMARWEQLLKDIAAQINAQKLSIDAASKQMESDMRDFDKRVAQLEQERKSAGLFKIALKKEIKEKIEQALVEKESAQASHRAEQARLQNELKLWEEKQEEVKKVYPMIEPKEGDVFLLGKDPLSNGKTPILWQVVQVSKSNLALISRDVLDYAPFKSDSIFCKKSSYEEWLKDFEKKAFSSEEKLLLKPSPIKEGERAQYAFVFTKFDAEKHLEKYLAAKPTKTLLNYIKRDRTIDDFDKEAYARAAETSYWLHSRNPLSEYTVHRIRRNNSTYKWEINTVCNVTNDGYVLGVRPAVLVDRKKLAKYAVDLFSHL